MQRNRNVLYSTRKYALNSESGEEKRGYKYLFLRNTAYLQGKKEVQG